MSWFVEFLLLIIFSIYLLHLYTSRKYDYWKKRNVPFIKPKPFVGNLWDVLIHKYDMGEFFGKLYQDVDAPFFGIFLFSKPALIVKDVNLTKRILVTDFDSFVDRNMYAPEHDPAVSRMIFIDKGNKWRAMRGKMSPFFSPSKVKSMFSVMENLGGSLCDHVHNKGNTELDVKYLSSKYSSDIITQCVFGINSRSLEDENSEFLKNAIKMFDTRLITSFRFTCYFFFHSLVRIFRIRLLDPSVISFLRKVFWECIKLREEDNIRGNDLIDIIVDLRKDEEFCERQKFEGDAVIAQALLFFAAGFDTTGSTIAFTLYSLCWNPDVQHKLRKNIEDVVKKQNGKLTVESVEEMVYLDWVIKETLRRYSPVPILDRVCNTEYEIPGTEVILDKGVAIILPLQGIQKDPKYFEEPEKYIPERFENLKEDMAYLPFGCGPRACIGRRFGLLAVKIAIIRILGDFELRPTDETPKSLIFSTKSVIPQPVGKLPVSFVKVQSLFENQ